MTSPEAEATVPKGPPADRRVVAGLGVLGIAVVGALLLGDPDARILPVDPAAWFGPAFRRLSAEYAETKYALWATGTILRWGTLAGLVLVGAGPVLAGLGRRLGRRRFLPSAFLAALLLLVVLALTSLPLSFASGFHVEHLYGLSTQSVAGWLLDTSRRLGFWIVVYAAAAAGFLVCLRRWPRRGWLVAAFAGAATKPTTAIAADAEETNRIATLTVFGRDEIA